MPTILTMILRAKIQLTAVKLAQVHFDLEYSSNKARWFVIFTKKTCEIGIYEKAVDEGHVLGSDLTS